MAQPYIFISHSSKDNPAAAEIVDDLQARGIKLWIDFDRLENGSQWLNRIEKAIDDSAAILVLISRSSRRAEWVMRECLYALQLRKPLFIALLDNVPLPLLLVDRQYNDLTQDYDETIVRLISDLQSALRNPSTHSEPQPLPDSVSIDATQNNFFAYLSQMDDGDALATLARDIFTWSKKQVNETEFSGRFRPAFHARVHIAEKSVTVFSLLAYLRHPALQIPLDNLGKYPPFTRKDERVAILRQLEALLPQDDSFERDRADRRPTIPLSYLLGDAERLETFKQIVTNIIAQVQNAT